MRAYSLLTIKSLDEEQRIIEGMATTPSTDRAGDVVDPLGAQFSLPIPLLWQHRLESPIGEVLSAKVTEAGIEFRAQVAKLAEPSPLRDTIETAWAAIKSRLVRGVSIRLKQIKTEPIRGTLGLRYKIWEWLELSAVTIPDNAQATIATVKSFDVDASAAPGTAPPVPPPGAAGPVKLIPPKPGARAVNTTTEQIKAFEETRAAKAARMSEIQTAASAAGQTKDEAQQEEFDTLRDEIKSIDRELVDLRDMEALNVTKAVPVAGTNVEAAAASRGTGTVVKTSPTLPPGIRFARVVKCIGVAAKRNRDVAMVAAEMYPDDGLIAKAAIAAGSTADTTWAGNLVGDETSVFADFVEFLRPQTIIGKFGVGGVPSLRRVPFRTPLIGQTTGGDGYWVGEGKAKGLTKFDFSRTTLDELKVANIAVLTDEVLRKSSPAADEIVRNQLAAALRGRMDTDFIDPAKVLDAGISPASITNGVAAITSSGNTAAAVRADIKALFDAFIAFNNAPTSGVFIMPATVALSLSLMQNPLGQPEFPQITMHGGFLFGLPVIVSEYAPTDSDGAIVVLVNATDIYLGDEGGIAIDISREASLQMDSEPTGSSVGSPPTAAPLVSLWQTNSVGFRAERIINWKVRRTGAVQLLDAVTWGDPEA